MRRLEAIIRMYDVTDWAWYDLNERTLKGNKCFDITFNFETMHECSFNLTVFKSVLYINDVKCTVFSKSFIKSLFYEIGNFMKATK